VIVVGSSLLRATEAPICHPDALSREVCCLPQAHIRDVTKSLPSLVSSNDYYPLLLFHVGTNDTARKSLRSIKQDYRDLGAAVRDSGVQVASSSILLVKGKGIQRASQIWQIIKCLRTDATARCFVT